MSEATPEQPVDETDADLDFTGDAVPDDASTNSQADSEDAQ